MKKRDYLTRGLVAIITIMFLLPVQPLFGSDSLTGAQDELPLTRDLLKQDEFQLTRDLIKSQKKLAILKSMGLTDKEREGFWPIYDDYQGKIDKINDRKIMLVAGYAKTYMEKSLTDEKALEMLDEFLSIEKQRLQYINVYVQKFKAVIPPKKVVRYFQIETKINALGNYALARGVPLLK